MEASTKQAAARRRAVRGAATALAALLIAGVGSAPALAAPAGVGSLPPIRYVAQGFDDFTWAPTDRGAPAGFDPQQGTLEVEVDRAHANPHPHYRTEGQVASIPLRANAGTVADPDPRDIVSVKVDLFVDPAWAGLPASTSNTGEQRSFAFGMWLEVPYHPFYPGSKAWPTVEIASDEHGDPVATVLDTTNRVPAADSPEVPVSFGDTVTLEIRYNQADYSYYYFVDGTLIFEHQ